MLAKFFTLALAATTSVSAFNQGFNYASTKPDGSARVEADFMADFTAAKNLAGTSGFTSARLYTMIQAGSATDPIQAISAAIKTKTTLLLGMWCSAGSDIVDNEITALKNAVSTYGKDFTDLIVGISVGSEDLYRSSAMGIAAKAGIGASPATVAEYIKRVKAAVSTLSINAPVGHVDTWTAWVDGNNADVISAVDWIGTDAYPYFQSTMSNDISVGGDLLFQAVDNTKGVAQGKDVWLTETGWPVTGKTQNLAVANVANAKSYWDQVACKTIGKMNLYWYTLSDTSPSMTDPSFGIVGSDLSQGPLYDLSCSAQNTTSSSASSSSSASATSSASSSATGASSSSASTTSVADLGSPGGSASNPSSTAAASGSSGMVTSKATGTASATGTAVATYPHVSGNGSASATSMPQPSQATSTGATSFVSVLAIAGSAFVAFYAAYFL